MTKSLTDCGYSAVARERGIAVFRNKRASAIELAAQGVLRVPTDQLQRALVDYGRHVSYLDRLAESRVLRRDKGELLVYQRLALPLLSDRDFTLDVRWGKDGEVRWVDFHAVTDKGPRPRKGVVRVTHHRGSWELLPIMSGKATLARYQVSLDLAGYLPRWMARSSAGKEVPDLFAAICTMAVGRDKAREHCP